MFDIILITPETNHPEEVSILHTLVRAYNISIHVRKPRFTEEAYRLYLSQYASILSHMVIHEHHTLAKEFSVKGIHLKEADRKCVTENANNVRVVSTGFHSLEDIKNNTHAFDYIFFSPLFKSISKEKYGTDTSPEEVTAIVQQVKKLTSIPVIGLGGISTENIVMVKNSGFDGAALLGAVWESEEPIEVFERSLKLKA